ncbi:hypothetical protein, partial [Escherichia coli]|uniref:hypothetical protein n=1 Tax=Escherichia coli TaxID=562 RepID=UPI001BAFFC34
IKIDHAERETTGVEGKAERLTWHKAWTAVSSGFSISYTSSRSRRLKYPQRTINAIPDIILDGVNTETISVFHF